MCFSTQPVMNDSMGSRGPGGLGGRGERLLLLLCPLWCCVGPMDIVSNLILIVCVCVSQCQVSMLCVMWTHPPNVLISVTLCLLTTCPLPPNPLAHPLHSLYLSHPFPQLLHRPHPSFLLWIFRAPVPSVWVCVLAKGGSKLWIIYIIIHPIHFVFLLFLLKRNL